MNFKLIVLVPILFLSLSAAAQDNDWKVLAKKDVGFKTDTDVITLYGNEKHIEKIKLVCNQGTLKIKSLELIYQSGETKTHQPKGTGVLTKGTSSIPIKVEPDQELKKIQIQYEAYGNMLLTKRAKVEVMGLVKTKKDK